MAGRTAASKTGGRKTSNTKTTAPANGNNKRSMTPEHKAALAEGRKQSKIVANYLAAIGTKKKRGRKVTIETLQARLAKAEDDIKTASPLDKLKFTQFIKDTRAQIERMQATTSVADVDSLEKEFVKVGKAYADAHGYDRSSFIACGVEKRVLVAAGI